MNILRWGGVTLVLACIIFGLHNYKSSLQQAASEQAAMMPEPSATVTATEVSSINYQQTVRVNGEVQAYKYLQLTNELAGQITKLNAASGSLVKKGQVLIELDHRDEDARLVSAQATLTLNEQTLHRYITLHKSKEISDELVDQANANVQIARSNVEVLTTAIAKKQLIAPFNAKVGIHTLEVGQYLDNNSQVLALVGVNNFTWVDFYLPQFYQELSLGSVVKLSPINQTSSFDAKIIAVAPLLSKSSRNLKYRAEIVSSKLALKPNTLISVDAPTGPMASLVSVPDLAIKRDPFGSYVFILEPDADGQSHRAKLVKVELGDRQGDRIIVTSGLSKGQLIANKGSFKLFPGMKVYIVTPENYNAKSSE
ncbi:MAG: efflux RND transporter periplasmic adaptor subunit [Alteromonadales bacterium]|nr:efflux RND transporter periplasmic adaptor subunit [Alteromonadales bacterium]